MRWTAALVLFVAVGSTAVGTAGARTAAGTRNYAHGGGRIWVQHAIESAAARLALPECRKIFTDFVTAEGVPLSAVLAQRRTSAENYLTQGIWFMDGDREPSCRTKDIAAFTQTGSRVVYVCTARVTARRIGDGEIVVIHEMLHSLGLGENPPTPAQVTKRVLTRCGG